MKRAKPCKLLKIPTEIKGKLTKAIIDSGADECYIKANLVEDLKIDIEEVEKKNITAYGNKEVETDGEIKIKMNIAGRVIEQVFNVISDSNMKSDLILGMNFLKSNAVNLDIKNKIVRIGKNSGQNSKFKMNENDEIIEVRHAKIPVYSDKNMKIENNTNALTTFKVNNINIKGNNYYFEGLEDSGVKYHCGIINNHDQQIVVENTTEKKRKIKEGDKIGEISMLIEDEEKNDDESWTLDKLKEKININEAVISEDEKQEVFKMLLSVKEALSTGDSDIGSAKIKPHHIELHDYTPIWQKARQFAKPIEDEIEDQCQELLMNDIIEHSNSSWSSPCVPIRKSDGGLRLCIDYRKVNKVTKAEKFPMPNLNNCLYSAHNVQYFTKLDLVRGYYQVNLDEESKDLTAFSTSKNHFQFKRLSFGLKNSGIAFQKMMQQMLSPLRSSRIIVYIDDILIMSHSFEEHLEMVKKVLCTLRKYQIKIKVKKCEFFMKEVSFLGHILSVNGIRKSPDYVKKVKEFQKPKTIADMKKFLGLINFQRKFIQNCSTIIKPLTEITGKPEKEIIEWTEEMDKAHEKVIEELMREVTLNYPDYEEGAEKLELYVDASDTGAGAALMQPEKDDYKVIGYNSMSFSDSQQRYSTVERELTAVRWGCDVFKPFIYGIPFILYTDHEPLVYMHNMAARNKRITRTLEDISEYDFQIKYVPGSENVTADYLSRLENPKPQGEYDGSLGLPKELKIREKVDGGGNSMFEALIIAMECSLTSSDDDDDVSLPEDHLQMRKEVIQELISNMDKYKIANNKIEKNKLKLMMSPNQLPCNNALLATSALYNVEIRVYHNIKTPVIFNANSEKTKNRILNLQCIAYIHYNPLLSRKVVEVERTKRNVNTINIKRDSYVIEEPMDVDLNCEELYEMESIEGNCTHDPSASHMKARYNGEEVCVILDTGSEISVIGRDTWNSMKRGDEIESLEKVKAQGIVGESSESEIIVNIKIELNEFETPEEFPFCIVSQDSIPCCMLLGLNFLKEFGSSIDFSCGKLEFNNKHKSWIKSRQPTKKSKVTTVEVVESEEELTSKRLIPKYMICNEELKVMQDGDHAVSMIKEKIIKGIGIKQWNEPYLKQFRRYHGEMKIEGEILIRKNENFNAIITSYAFMVEIIVKTHQQLAHIGRHKLIDLVIKQFWHPAIDSIAREICKTCNYCQLNKNNSQHQKPPTLKISVQKPYELMSIDLVALPKTSSGNVAALVLVDHCSKWMTAAPVRNKSSVSVAKTLKYQMIPNLLRTPEKILSDNGTEFRGQETERVMDEFGVKHVYSSPYTPTANGGVERVNQTVTRFLKGLTEKENKWDEVLSKAIMIYNNTYHSEIKCTPTDFLMNNSHETSKQIPVDNETKDHWREGHPNFKFFRLDRRLSRKLQE